jgi:hypothetical protein
MRSRDLNPKEIGPAIMRLQAEQSSDLDFPQLIPLGRAAELLYGPTVWTRLLRNLHSAWDNTIDFLHMPVHKIEDFTEGELLFTAAGLTDFLEKRKQVRYVPALRMEVLTYDLDGSLRIDLADMIQRLTSTQA